MRVMAADVCEVEYIKSNTIRSEAGTILYIEVGHADTTG
jgi:hypothetical protein